LLFFATTINYMDRQILGILAPRLKEEIGWSERDYAHVVTAFQAAYAIGLVCFGRFIDTRGTKPGYAIAIVLWSVAAMCHALARSVFGFGAARFGLGLGEAGNFPAAVKAVAEWFPKKERALATGLFNSGTNIGAILAPLVVPWLAIHLGWQMAFVALGVLGFFWLIFWQLLYDSPETSRRISPEELAYIQSDPQEPAPEKIPWRRLFAFRETWAYIGTSILVGPVWWFYLFWLPPFLNRQYSLDLTTLGAPLVAIYTATCFGSIIGGWLPTLFFRLGWSVNGARKTALLICALCTLPVVFATRTPHLWVATALIALAASAHQGWSANMYTVVSDLFPKGAVASVVGLGATFGSVASIIFAESAGLILERTGSYYSLFIVCGSAYLAALAILQVLAPRMTPVRIEHAAE
jgi:ACS family hexuronate transporter-like MFS transporter